MVEPKTKITESGVLYVPKELREAFSRDMKNITICTAAIFFTRALESYASSKKTRRATREAFSAGSSARAKAVTRGGICGLREVLCLSVREEILAKLQANEPF